MKNSPKMIKIFTPSFADENNINAQNLTVKQIVRRLDPDYFQVTMFYKDNIVDFIKNRGNTKFIKWFKHGNLIRFFFIIYLINMIFIFTHAIHYWRSYSL